MDAISNPETGASCEEIGKPNQMDEMDFCEGDLAFKEEEEEASSASHGLSFMFDQDKNEFRDVDSDNIPSDETSSTLLVTKEMLMEFTWEKFNELQGLYDPLDPLKSGKIDLDSAETRKSESRIDLPMILSSDLAFIVHFLMFL